MENFLFLMLLSATALWTVASVKWYRDRNSVMFFVTAVIAMVSFFAAFHLRG